MPIEKASFPTHLESVTVWNFQMTVRRIVLIFFCLWITLAVAMKLSIFFQISFPVTLISMGVAVGLSFLAAYTIEKIDERP